MSRSKLLPALAASLFINTATLQQAEIQIPQYTVTNTAREPVVSAEYARDIEALRNYFSDYLKAAKKRGYLTKSDKVSFVVHDIEHNTDVIDINGDDQVMAASTIKLFAMSAYFDLVESGKLIYGWMDRDTLWKMIKVSDNSAANTIMRKIGYVLGVPPESAPIATHEVLAERHPEFKKTEIREFIPDEGKDNGRTYKNMTSARDLVEYYRMLWERELSYSDEMLKYLGLPKHTRIFTGGCGTSEEFNKTGTVYGQVSDSALVLIKGSNGEEYPYAIAAIVEDRTKTIDANRKKSYDRWVGERRIVIRDLSKRVYETLYKGHLGKDYTCKPVIKKPVKSPPKKPVKKTVKKQR